MQPNFGSADRLHTTALTCKLATNAQTGPQTDAASGMASLKIHRPFERRNHVHVPRCPLILNETQGPIDKYVRNIQIELETLDVIN
jgi:hypothetical protein